MSRKLYIATGKNINDTSWITVETTWEDFVQELKNHTIVTTETMKEYASFSKAEKLKYKDVGGFVGGKVINGRKKKENIWCRSILSLDIDNGNSETLSLLKEKLKGLSYFISTTHSSTPEFPRFRVLCPLAKDVAPSEYVKIANSFMSSVEVDFDKTSDQAERMMFWPSYPVDAPINFIENSGEYFPVSPGTHTTPHTEILPEHSHKSAMEDPREKSGVIGQFCRCFGIVEAIDHFIPNIYTRYYNNRYTYSQGSTAGGLVIYDNLYCYSNHATDPLSGKEYNAWDMVRIHLYLDSDTGIDSKTAMSNRPSYKKMLELLENDKVFQNFKNKEKIDKLKDTYGDLSEDKWMLGLETFKKSSEFKPTVSNIMSILENDENISGKMKRNIFEGKDVVYGDLPWRRLETKNRLWKNDDLSNLIVYIGKKYGIQNKDIITTCFDAEMSHHEYHPVIDYLNTLKWDGTPRLDTFFIDYLGAENTTLTRAFTRKHLIAGIMRILSPVVRHYDCLILLIGAQGIGKTTILRKLSKGWYCDYLGDIEKKDAVENLQGKWIVSMDELGSLLKSKIEVQKAFISRDTDRVRMAYQRYAEDYRRQCILFGTSNESNMLKDVTGNRRFFPIVCTRENAKYNVFEDLTDATIDQVWAEAKYYYDQGENYIIDKDLWKDVELLQSEHTDFAVDERVQLIESYLDQSLPFSWENMDKQKRRDFFYNSDKSQYGPLSLKRNQVSAIEIANECFFQNIGSDKLKYQTRDINMLMNYVHGWEKTNKKYEPKNVYGRQRFYIRNTPNEEENTDEDYDL